GRLDVRAADARVRPRRREPHVHVRVQPVGLARHGRAVAGGRGSGHVGRPRTRHARRAAAGPAGNRGRAGRVTGRYVGLMATTFADVARARYILLTTFAKDGRPKPNPIWAAPDGDRLLVITEADSWKVNRIRNTSRVTLAPCDMRG